MSPQNIDPPDVTRQPLPQAGPGADKNGNPADGREQQAGAEDITYEPVPPQ